MLMSITYPESMNNLEAEAYADYAVRKYGESNVRAVDIEVSPANSNVVEITAHLVSDPRERIARLSPAFVDGMVFAKGDVQ